MWIINCILLVMGTVAAVCGISFFLRNKESSGNLRKIILSYGLSSALWCIIYGLVGFCSDFAVCEALRKIGVLAVDAFLVTEAFLGMEMTGKDHKYLSHVFLWSETLLAVIDFFALSDGRLHVYIRKAEVTTWVNNSDMVFARTFHGFFMIFSFLLFFSWWVVWRKTPHPRRTEKFLILFCISNFVMLFFSIPDTVLPMMGKSAVSTSGIGGSLCAIVMWYGATQMGSFDIRMGNLRDRLFDFIEAGIIVFDVNKKVAIVNRYAKTLIEDQETKEKRIEDFFDVTADELAGLFAAAADRMYTGRLWNRNRTKAYSVRLSAVKDSFGEVFCHMCVFVDVTEEVEAVAKYELANQAKSRFLAQMSHEIRTPINAVLGMNEMILRESEDEEILEYAANIESAGNTLLSLINSILDFSKIEDGKMEIVTVEYDTASFINDLYQSVIQRADVKGLLLIMDIDETLPCTLIGDNVRFSQVIMNLLTNAVKYTEKGSVTLSMKASERMGKRISIDVSVKDTGIGIREEDRGRLFESFERLDEVRNHNIEGTGLGISVVTNLLSLMGSRLCLDSTYGEGSTFSFSIEQEVADETPIGNYEKRLKESKVYKNKDNLIRAPKARILVVDDNDMNLKVARNLLKLCGIKPEEASSGEETIEKLKENSYDIVFLDHMMPGMDGIETLHRLKEDRLIPEGTVMVVLTANAVVGAREQYLKEGFADYLSKPIEIRQLVEKLKKYLPEKAYGNQEPENGIMEFEPEDEKNEDMPKGFGTKQNYDISRIREAGLDVEEGLNYCARDEALYFEMLTDFIKTCQRKLGELDHFYRDENWHDYEVAVHALKGNLRLVGLKTCYERAMALESAAESRNTGYVRDNHKVFLQMVSDAEKRIRASAS